MSLDLLKARLKDKSINGVWVFRGSEEYTKDFYIKLVRGIVDSSPMPEMNHTILEGEWITPQSLGEAAMGLPVMCDRMIIELRDIPLSKMKPADIKLYGEIINSLAEDIILLVIFRGNEDSAAAKKSAAGQFLDLLSGGTTVEFAEEKGDKLANWVSRHFTAGGKHAGRTAVDTLIEVAGTDMYTLQGEIDKLIHGISDKEITRNHIIEFCSRNDEYKIYELSDAVLKKNIKKALSVLDNLRETKTDPVVIIGYLSRYFSDLMRVWAAVSDGETKSAAAKKVRKSEWQVGHMLTALSARRKGFAEYALSEIFRLDVKTKSSGVNTWLLTEAMLCRIAVYG